MSSAARPRGLSSTGRVLRTVLRTVRRGRRSGRARFSIVLRTSPSFFLRSRFGRDAPLIVAIAIWRLIAGRTVIWLLSAACARGTTTTSTMTSRL